MWIRLRQEADQSGHLHGRGLTRVCVCSQAPLEGAEVARGHFPGRTAQAGTTPGLFPSVNTYKSRPAHQKALARISEPGTHLPRPLKATSQGSL